MFNSIPSYLRKLKGINSTASQIDAGIARANSIQDVSAVVAGLTVTGTQISKAVSNTFSSRASASQLLDYKYDDAIIDIDFTKGMYYWDNDFHSLTDMLYSQLPTISTNGYTPAANDKLRIPFVDWINSNKQNYIIVLEYAFNSYAYGETICSLYAGNPKFRLEVTGNYTYLQNDTMSEQHNQASSYFGNKLHVIALNNSGKLITSIDGKTQTSSNTFTEYSGNIASIGIGYNINNNGNASVGSTIKRISIFPITADKEKVISLAARQDLIKKSAVPLSYKELSNIPKNATMYLDFLNKIYYLDNQKKTINDFGYTVAPNITSRGLYCQTSGLIFKSLGWLNPDEGTFFAEIDTDDLVDSNSRTILSLFGNSPGNNRTDIVTDGVYYQVNNSNMNVSAVIGNKDHNIRRIVFSYKTNEAAICSGGYDVVAATNINSVTGLSYIAARIGYRFDGNAPLNGYIRKIWYIPNKLTKTEIKKTANNESLPKLFLCGDSFCAALWKKYIASYLEDTNFRITLSDGVGGSTLENQEFRFINRLEDIKDSIMILTDDSSATTTDATSIQELIDRTRRIVNMSNGKYLIMEKGLDTGVGLVSNIVSNPNRTAVIAALKAAFPNRFVDVDALMRASTDGSALDTQYLAWGLWPASVYNTAPANPFSGGSLDFHLNDKGNQIYATAAVNKLKSLNWIS